MNGADQGTPALRGAFYLYRVVFSPILHAISPTQCTFLPTCSEYGYVAIARHGLLKGSWLALRRLARCHPLGAGGFDPVPARGEAHRRQGVSKCHHLP